jgi:hypothetical protein
MILTDSRNVTRNYFLKIILLQYSNKDSIPRKCITFLFSFSKITLVVQILRILVHTSEYVGFEIPSALVMKLPTFCDIGPCSLYVNQRFGATHQLHFQDRKSAD